MKIKTPSIASRLTAHLTGDGTPNDNTTDALYREARGIAPDAVTDLEAVERWAFETLMNSPEAKAADLRSIPGDFDMAGPETTQPRFYVEPAYACNDLARMRRGAQDIIGYDVRDRKTGLVESPCDTQQEADAECEELNKANPS